MGDKDAHRPLAVTSGRAQEETRSYCNKHIVQTFIYNIIDATTE
jgi:hypothetical protein